MKNDREVELLERSCKISTQLLEGFRERHYRRIGRRRTRAALITKMQTNECGAVRDQVDDANGTFVIAVVFHELFSRDFHKCIAAYERQGRQLSASARA